MGETGSERLTEPAMDQLHLQIDNDHAARFRYEIFDVSGRLVRTADLGARTALQETLPIGDLAQGTYTLRLWKGHNRINRCFIKF